ncbi:hypothetical protein VTN02DRAFT_1450 [Thermoascus thermophilus]
MPLFEISSISKPVMGLGFRLETSGLWPSWSWATGTALARTPRSRRTVRKEVTLMRAINGRVDRQRKKRVVPTPAVFVR